MTFELYLIVGLWVCIGLLGFGMIELRHQTKALRDRFVVEDASLHNLYELIKLEGERVTLLTLRVQELEGPEKPDLENPHLLYTVKDQLDGDQD